MIELNVLDVVGPLPGDNSCFVVLSTRDRSKIFAIQCGYSDAEMCYGILNGSLSVTPYEFLTDVLAAVNIQVEHAELDTVSPCLYGKMFLKAENQEKPLKIVSSNPCAIINAALSGKAAIQISDDLYAKLIDSTIEYHRLKAVLMRLFPLPILDNTDVLRVMSEFVDTIQFRQTSSV